MNKYAFLLLLVPSLANAHGGELTFLFNHALIYFGLVIFSAFVSPPGVKLAISMGLMIGYPLLFFYVFPDLDGSDNTWDKAAYITAAAIVGVLLALRLRFQMAKMNTGSPASQEIWRNK